MTTRTLKLNYRIPHWAVRSPRDNWFVSNEQLTKWQQDTATVKAYNLTVYKAAEAERTEIVHRVEKFYGVNSTEARTIRATKLESPPTLDNEWAKVLSRVREAHKREEERRYAQEQHERRVVAGRKAAETRRKNREPREEYIEGMS